MAQRRRCAAMPLVALARQDVSDRAGPPGRQVQDEPRSFKPARHGEWLPRSTVDALSFRRSCRGQDEGERTAARARYRRHASAPPTDDLDPGEPGWSNIAR